MPRKLLLLLLLVAPLLTLAGEAGFTDPSVGRIYNALKGVLTTLEKSDITPSPVPGLYEVLVGARLYYVSGDGKYLISGKMINLKDGSDVTEKKVAQARKRMIDAVGEKNMIIFGPDKPKHTVTVFTDVDCGYCRKLHSQIKGYNALGIRIRYLFYPRAGLDSDSARKAVAVWCASDRKKALTEAKQGKRIPYKECKNPVANDYLLGNLVGVNGTPALVLEDGELLTGYLPPARLKTVLDEKFPHHK